MRNKTLSLNADRVLCALAIRKDPSNRYWYRAFLLEPNLALYRKCNLCDYCETTDTPNHIPIDEHGLFHLKEHNLLALL